MAKMKKRQFNVHLDEEDQKLLTDLRREVAKAKDLKSLSQADVLRMGLRELARKHGLLTDTRDDGNS